MPGATTSHCATCHTSSGKCAQHSCSRLARLFAEGCRVLVSVLKDGATCNTSSGKGCEMCKACAEFWGPGLASVAAAGMHRSHSRGACPRSSKACLQTCGSASSASTWGASLRCIDALKPLLLRSPLACRPVDLPHLRARGVRPLPRLPCGGALAGQRARLCLRTGDAGTWKLTPFCASRLLHMC